MAKRYYIVAGDLTTAGGYVLAANNTRSSIMDKLMIVEGDPVVCLCGQPGYVMCDGPRLPHDKIEGRHKALENDLVVGCACAIPPRLIAGGQTIASQTSEGDWDTWQAGGLAGTASFAAAQDALAQYDEQIQFSLPDKTPLASTPYVLTLVDGSTVEGRTDADGKTERITTALAMAIIRAEFYPDTIYACDCLMEHMCETGGRSPSPALEVELRGVQTNSTDVGHSVVNHPLPPATQSRAMTSGEIAMARTIFKDAIDYSRVKIHKGGLFGRPDATGNAMTPKGEIYFPSQKGYQPDFSSASDYGSCMN